MDDSGCQRFRLILPVTTNDKRGSQMLQEGHELAEDERVGVGLQCLTCLEVDLNDEDHESLPLETCGGPRG